MEDAAIMEFLNSHQTLSGLAVLAAYIWLRDFVLGVRHFRNTKNGSRVATCSDLEPIRNQLLQEFGGQDERGIKHEGALKQRFRLIFHRLTLIARKQDIDTTTESWNNPPEE